MAGGHVALSVTLSALSNALGVITFPILARLAVGVFLGREAVRAFPSVELLVQLVALVLVPMTGGMIARRFASTAGIAAAYGEFIVACFVVQVICTAVALRVLRAFSSAAPPSAGPSPGERPDAGSGSGRDAEVGSMAGAIARSPGLE